MNATALRGCSRVALRRVCTRSTLALLVLALALGLARAWSATARLPEHVASNAALVLWLGWSGALVPLGAAWLGARAGARTPRDAAWVSRWPRRPLAAHAVLCIGGAVVAAALVCTGVAAATWSVARASVVDGAFVRALPGPALLLPPHSEPERWRFEDPRDVLRAGRELRVGVAAIGGTAATARLRATRVAARATATATAATELVAAMPATTTPAAPTTTAPTTTAPATHGRDDTREYERLVVGGARLRVPLPPGEGPVELELQHAGGAAWLQLTADAGVLCDARDARLAALAAWSARLALAGVGAAALAFGCARWMRAGLAAALALLPFAATAFGAALPSAWPLADWRACIERAADGIASPWPAPLAYAVVLGMCGVGLALTAVRGGRA